MKYLTGQFGVSVLALLLAAFVAQAAAPLLWEDTFDGTPDPPLDPDYVLHPSSSGMYLVAGTGGPDDNDLFLEDYNFYYGGREFGVPGSDAKEFTFTYDSVIAGGGSALGHEVRLNHIPDDPGTTEVNEERQLAVAYHGTQWVLLRWRDFRLPIPGGDPFTQVQLIHYIGNEWSRPFYMDIDYDGPGRTISMKSYVDEARTTLNVNGDITWNLDSSWDPYLQGGYVGFSTYGTEKYDNFRIVGVSDPIQTWAVDSGGNWGDGGNWSGGPGPNANDESAVFGSAITAARTVYTDQPVTVKGIQFDNANTYRIAGDTINLEADEGNASIDVDQGDHEFQASVSLSSDTDADVAAGASLTFSNVLSLSGNTLTKTGDGSVSINNKLNTGGGSVIGVGGTIGGDGQVGGDLTNTSATVAPGSSAGTLSVEGNFSQGILGTLAIELAGTAEGEFDVLAVTGSATLGGTLEITELYTPGGSDTWIILTAAGGITGDFNTITAGYQVALASGNTELVLSLTTALLPGDANGDGCVDDLDLTALAVHWQQSTSEWSHGDFNGDGIVDDLDLTALAVNWQQGCGGGGSLTAANVPEPGSALLLLLGFAAGTSRRGRRS